MAYGKNHKNWGGYEDISGNFWSNLTSKADQRNIPFKITMKDAWNQFLKQDKKCMLTKWDISFSRNRFTIYNQASLDRIDSSIGYTLDNIQWLHKDVNISKWEFSVDKFVDLCHLVSDYNPIKQPMIPIEIYGCNENWNGVGNLSVYKFDSFLRNANKRKIDFQVNIQELWNIYIKQNARCNLSGIPIYFNSTRVEGVLNNLASLDRINPGLPALHRNPVQTPSNCAG